MLGFAMSALSLLISLGYLVAKLVFWDQFQLGLAPVLIGLFFFASVQLFFIGIQGEYIGAIYTQVRKLPPVIERERIGFSARPETGEPAGGRESPSRGHLRGQRGESGP
jgi:hypothetical protein